MADPFTIISTVMSAVGALSQANAASKNAKAQANVARYNAEVSRQQSQTALQVSAAQQEEQRRKNVQILGNQRAAAAQSGLGFGGSNADILDQSATLSELDRLNIAYEGEMRSRGFSTQSTLDTYQSGVYDRNAKDAKTAGLFGAATAIATGAASYYNKIPTKSTVAGPGMRFGGGGLGFRSGGGMGLRV
jgi:hypothetical protein